MARGCSDITLDGTQLPQKGGTAAPTFRPMSVAKRLDGSRCQMRQMGTQLSTERGTTAPPLFDPCLLWSNGRPSQLMPCSCMNVTHGVIFNNCPSTVLYDADACVAEHHDGRTDYIAALQVWCQLLKLSITFNSGVTS